MGPNYLESSLNFCPCLPVRMFPSFLNLTFLLMIFPAVPALLWTIIMSFHYVIFNWNNGTSIGNARHKEQGYRHMMTFFCTGGNIDCLGLSSDKT